MKGADNSFHVDSHVCNSSGRLNLCTTQLLLSFGEGRYLELGSHDCHTVSDVEAAVSKHNVTRIQFGQYVAMFSDILVTSSTTPPL